MSRTILFIAAFWLAVSMWGQSGIMPRRSSSIKIPSQETMEKITEADPELVSREPVSTLSDTTSRALLFSPVAVDMLGFDKRMSDTKESFLLRNNTPYRLSRVVLKMIYRTPDGQMIDYRTRMVDCDLLPRSTRKCEIESFDRSKNYYHVDSPPSRVSGRPFKVSFQLLRYDIVIEP